MLKDQTIMEKYFSALERYCSLTPAELICHRRCCSMPGRAYLRKDNSCKNWSKGIIFTVFKRRQKAYCDKHRDLGKVINTCDDDQLNLIQKIQHTFQCITSTKCNGWKSSTFILQNLLRTINPENFSSIGQIHLKISFSTAKMTRFEKTSFKLMTTEIVKIKLYYLNIQISWKTKPRFFKSHLKLTVLILKYTRTIFWNI